jgi:hypothetical protein
MEAEVKRSRASWEWPTTCRSDTEALTIPQHGGT